MLLDEANARKHSLAITLQIIFFLPSSLLLKKKCHFCFELKFRANGSDLGSREKVPLQISNSVSPYLKHLSK